MFWVLYVSDKNNRSKYVLKTGIVAELIVKPQECQFLDGDALKCLCEMLQGIVNLQPACCRALAWIEKSCFLSGNASCDVQSGLRTVHVSVRRVTVKRNCVGELWHI